MYHSLSLCFEIRSDHEDFTEIHLREISFPLCNSASFTPLLTCIHSRSKKEMPLSFNVYRWLYILHVIGVLVGLFPHLCVLRKWQLVRKSQLGLTTLWNFNFALIFSCLLLFNPAKFSFFMFSLFCIVHNHAVLTRIKSIVQIKLTQLCHAVHWQWIFRSL